MAGTRRLVKQVGQQQTQGHAQPVGAHIQDKSGKTGEGRGTVGMGGGEPPQEQGIAPEPAQPARVDGLALGSFAGVGKGLPAYAAGVGWRPA